MTIRVRELGIEGLLCEAQRWQTLSSRAENATLFNSWHWARAWWYCRDDQSRAEITIKLFAATDESGEWLGLAPLFVRRTRRQGIPIRCMQFIGGAVGMHTVFRTEYNDLLIADGAGDAVRETLLRAIVASAEWDELVLADVPRPALFEHVTSCLGVEGRVMADDLGYRADLSQGFESYLKALRGSARRQLFNKRKRLDELGGAQVVPVDAASWPTFVETLNAFHRERWGQNVIGDLRRQFVELLVEGDSADTPRQASSELHLQGSAISALLDIDYLGRRYNLQAGISEHTPSGISPGLLHFGFSMELASATNLQSYEFLIGTGKHENYKQAIASEEIRAVTRGYARPVWLRALYGFNDVVKRALGR